MLQKPRLPARLEKIPVPIAPWRILLAMMPPPSPLQERHQPLVWNTARRLPHRFSRGG